MNTLPSQLIQEKAVISDCGRYRYWLSRDVDNTQSLKPVVFLMLNPSTADADNDDPTIRRCMDYAKRWGGSQLIVVNLFALRATQPERLRDDATDDPVGSLNDEAIEVACDYAHAHDGLIVAAWGDHGAFMDRGKTVLSRIERFNPKCLKQNKSGMPAHPLYQKKDAPLLDIVL